MLNLLTLIQESCSDVVVDHEDMLLRKKVRHVFEDVYTGRVISSVPGFPDWYHIQYDNDVAIYTYKLREDLKRGDLEILV